MQALPKDYLTLRLVRLHRSEEWRESGEGLSFVLLKGGKGRYSLKDKAWDLQPGDVMVLNPAVGGKLQVQNGEVVFWCFSVCFEHLLPLFSSGEICLLQNITEKFNGSKLYAASCPLAKECHQLVESAPPQGNVDHRSQMLRIAAAVLSVEFLNARGQRTGFVRVEDHMIQVFESLSANELLTLSVGELADKFSCSRRHLNRLFHQHFGFSVGALRMEMRLLKAISLLRDPDAKIISVGEQCGFNHLGLFNTCFKRRFGSSPGRWRKIASQGNGQAFSVLKDESRICNSTKLSNGLGTTTDSGSSIRAKVHEILRAALPNAAANRTNNLIVGNGGDVTAAAKNARSGRDFRYRPAA